MIGLKAPRSTIYREDNPKSIQQIQEEKNKLKNNQKKNEKNNENRLFQSNKMSEYTDMDDDNMEMTTNPISRFTSNNSKNGKNGKNGIHDWEAIDDCTTVLETVRNENVRDGIKSSRSVMTNKKIIPSGHQKFKTLKYGFYNDSESRKEKRRIKNGENSISVFCKRYLRFRKSEDDEEESDENYSDEENDEENVLLKPQERSAKDLLLSHLWKVCKLTEFLLSNEVCGVGRDMYWDIQRYKELNRMSVPIKGRLVQHLVLACQFNAPSGKITEAIITEIFDLFVILSITFLSIFFLLFSVLFTD